MSTENRLECSILASDIVGEPVVPALLGATQEPITCKDHPFAIEGIVYRIAYLFWNDPQMTSFQCPNCNHMRNAIVIDIPSRGRTFEAVNRAVEDMVWKEKPCAPLADRLFEVFNEKVEKDGVNAQMTIPEVARLYNEVKPQSRSDSNSPAASSCRPIQRYRDIEVFHKDDDDCWLAKIGVFNMVMLAAITAVFTIYVYMQSAFIPTPFNPRGRTLIGISKANGLV